MPTLVAEAVENGSDRSGGEDLGSSPACQAAEPRSTAPPASRSEGLHGVFRVRVAAPLTRSYGLLWLAQGMNTRILRQQHRWVWLEEGGK